MSKRKIPEKPPSPQAPVERSQDPPVVLEASVLPTASSAAPSTFSLRSLMDSAKSHRGYLWLLLLPWILFVVNPNWPFQGLGHMDTWYYFGYFSHFPQYQRIAPQYSGERITWILPGFVLAHIFGHVYGTLLLHVISYYVSVCSIYYIVNKLRDERTALVAACFLGCHPLFIGANGWDYLDGGSVAYLALAFALLTKAAFQQRPALSTALAGAAWTALIVTYLFWAAFTPVCGFYYLCLRAYRSGARASVAAYARSAWALARPFAIGVSLTVFLLSLFHTLVYGRREFFLIGNVAMAARLAKMSSNPWIRTPGDQLANWFPKAPWLVFPMLSAALSFYLLFRWLKQRQTLDGSALGAVGSYCFCFSVMAFMTFRPARLLEIDFYASILIPLLFLVLALTVFEVPKQISSRLYYLVLLTACTVSILPLTKPLRYGMLLMYGLWLPYILGACGLLARVLWPRHALTWMILLICLSLAGFGLAPDYPGSAWRLRYNGLATWTRISESIDVIRTRLPNWQVPIFWIDDFSHPLTAEYRAIMCAVHVGNAMWHYPQVDDHASYPEGTAIVLITDKRDVFQSANEAMTRAGMPLSLRSQDFVSRDGISYWITIATVQKRS